VRLFVNQDVLPFMGQRSRRLARGEGQAFLIPAPRRRRVAACANPTGGVKEAHMKKLEGTAIVTSASKGSKGLGAGSAKSTVDSVGWR
jgi:hypothetical protein